MRRGWMVLAFMLATGCRKETPIERGVREYRRRHEDHLAQAAVATARTQALADDQLVRLSPQDGLALGLRVENTVLHLGETLRAHLVYENLGADGPISSTTCQGFSLGSEDQDSLVSTSAPVKFSCDEDDPTVDNNVALEPGQLRRADVSIEGTQLSFTHPGRYILVAGWQAFRPREGVMLRPDQYAVVASNQVLITVK